MKFPAHREELAGHVPVKPWMTGFILKTSFGLNGFLSKFSPVYIIFL